MTNLQIQTATEQELRDLNHRIVRELKWRQDYRTRGQLSQFSPGQKVWFLDRRGFRREGSITKFNQKTVEVLAQGARWRVSPSFLKPMEAIDGGAGTERAAETPR